MSLFLLKYVETQKKKLTAKVNEWKFSTRINLKNIIKQLKIMINTTLWKVLFKNNDGISKMTLLKIIWLI